MNQLKIFKILKGQRKNSSHPLARTSKGYAENILTPVTLSGVVVPWTKKLMSDGRNSEYKLVCASGSEYFFVTDQAWREVLSQHCWGDVKVKGLLNIANMTLIPQKVFPRGPTGQVESVIHLAGHRNGKNREEDNMNIEKSLNLISPTSNIGSTQLSHSNETFRDIFQRALNNRSNSRPPKVELTGVLIPCREFFRDSQFQFKLETDSNEHYLAIGAPLAKIAKKIAWEEVTVRGHLDLESNVIEVEKISLSETLEPLDAPMTFADPYLELDDLKRRIAKQGVLDLIADDRAS